MLVLRPQEALDFTIGDGTKSSPRLQMHIRNLEVDLYAFIFERYVRGLTVNLNANTLTVGGTNNLASSYGGTISGTGALTKAGTGSFTLSGNNSQVLLRPDGTRIGVRQLAGLIARRVVSDLRVGETRRRGERLGVIKFGSRVDLFVPEGYRVLVGVGDRVRHGETAMAEPGGSR